MKAIKKKEKRKKVMTVFGTRPEVIKLAPVIRALEEDKSFKSIVVATAQHREMLDQTLEVFGIKPRIDLNLMEKGQQLSCLASRILQSMQNILDAEKPDLLICQGDTTSAFAAGLAAYYNKIPVAHVEAGLRTFDHDHPFPEEGNRQLLSVISTLNFCPTQRARENLVKQAVEEKKIFVTGNTVIDSLLWIASKKYSFKSPILKKLNFSREKVVLVTTHRRENFGISMENTFKAILAIVKKFPDVRFVFPVHLNPNVRKAVNGILGNQERVLLVEPLDYEEFVHLMRRSFLILTDSGGVQEEAPTFGIPVLVLRKVTERAEALEGGNALLIGTKKSDIVDCVSSFLARPERVKDFRNRKNPFGDGKTGQRIKEEIKRFLKKQ
ncbi:MAG: UDP-N-acetylglucosamine 2-epimerase (non-hydrolyzing) [Nitrospinae bacterium]|nr:UDP-N-acetylglucosamine 2-epimerase (non-hydrolyzing) [Nitrospinota bacterium]